MAALVEATDTPNKALELFYQAIPDMTTRIQHMKKEGSIQYFTTFLSDYLRNAVVSAPASDVRNDIDHKLRFDVVAMDTFCANLLSTVTCQLTDFVEVFKQYIFHQRTPMKPIASCDIFWNVCAFMGTKATYSQFIWLCVIIIQAYDDGGKGIETLIAMFLCAPELRNPGIQVSADEIVVAISVYLELSGKAHVDDIHNIATFRELWKCIG